MEARTNAIRGKESWFLPGRPNLLLFPGGNPRAGMGDRSRKQEFKCTGIETAHGMALGF